MQHVKSRRFSILTFILFLLLLTVTAAAALFASGCSGTEHADGIVPPAREDAVFNPISSNEAAYDSSSFSIQDISRGNLILINSDYAYTFQDNGSLTNVFNNQTHSYSVRSKDIELNAEVIDALNSLMDDFQARSGLDTINLVSGYRSYELQQQLYDESLEQNGLEHTRLYVASPGHSEHHSGLAADLGLIFFSDGSSAEFDGTGEYAWIIDNAPYYGLIQRYTEAKTDLTNVASEPWHLRYVGLPHSLIMKENDFCLEEYIEYLRNFTYEGERLNYEYDGKQYEIYFVEGTDVKTPDNADYTISGNNVDGFIVTITK